jgi:hypothetical protein
MVQMVVSARFGGEEGRWVDIDIDTSKHAKARSDLKGGRIGKCFSSMDLSSRCGSRCTSKDFVFEIEGGVVTLSQKLPFLVITVTLCLFGLLYRVVAIHLVV